MWNAFKANVYFSIGLNALVQNRMSFPLKPKIYLFNKTRDKNITASSLQRVCWTYSCVSHFWGGKYPFVFSFYCLEDRQNPV